MYDQLGGGFHRYSVDDQWLVPHFEKMLYDNAQLASLYLHAWLATGDAEYRRVTEETLDYVLREMTHPVGRLLLGPGRRLRRRGGQVLRLDARRDPRASWATTTLARGGAAPTGAWTTGRTSRATASCSCPREPAEVAERARHQPGRGWPSTIAPRAADALRGPREARPPGPRRQGARLLERPRCSPAFAEAGRALGRPDYLAAAVRQRRVPHHRHGGGRPAAALVEGRPGRGSPAISRTTPWSAPGLLALYEATFDRRWLDESRRLAEEALRLFWNDGARGLLRHRPDQEALVVRPRNIFDNAVPSGTSVDHRVAAAARARHSARSATRRIALAGAPAHGRPHAELPLGLRALPLRAGLPPGARGRGRAGLARRAASAAAAPLARRRYSAGTSPNRVVVGRRGGRAGARRAAAPRRARRGGRQADRVRLPALRLPAAGDGRRTRSRASSTLGYNPDASLGEVS